MRWDEIENQPCSIARSLSVLGDRWTLLIIRNCFLGTRRFDVFQQQLGITRHRLADRLDRLVEDEVLCRVPYQERPLRHEYRLTEKGKDLYPVILSLVRWGDRWMDGGRGAPVIYKHVPCGHLTQPTMVCSECGEPLLARDITPLAGPGLKKSSEKRA